MKNNRHIAPLLVAALLLLPVLYVVSYFVMLSPKGTLVYVSTPNSFTYIVSGNYRFGGNWAARIYWPLEQADHKLFPKRWDLDRVVRLKR